MQAQYGIIGFPLTHSFSPAYFRKKFAAQGIDARYEPYAISTIAELAKIVKKVPGLRGLNVTIPYKQQVISSLDELDAAAEEIGAVNCIAIKKGYKKGYNTDVTGFAQSLNPLLQAQHVNALILGTGGSSKAVAWVLAQLGIHYHHVSRSKREGGITYDELTADDVARHKLIINTTPLGMYPATDAAAPIPYEGISDKHLLYDLVYNPGETKFLSFGKAKGAVIKNGLEMLQLQAEAAWAIWNNQL